MVTANFEFDGNIGTLTVKTHFGTEHKIRCEKSDGEIFRLGGTAINEVVCFEGVLLDPENGKFRAFYNPEHTFEGEAILSPEGWENPADRHCWVTEYYTLDMEGQEHSWLVSRKPIVDATHLFLNLDVLDGGENVIKRYRVSPFFGDYKVMYNE
jgi:hypothetical protein